MEGFSDLLFLLIMFLVISRSFGAARRKQKEEQSPQPSKRPAEQIERPRERVPGAPEPGARSREQLRSRREGAQGAREAVRPPIEAGPPGAPARRSDPVSEFRRRLIEAAREWEDEQRRRAGIPDEGSERVGMERQPSPAHEPPRRPARREHPAAREAAPAPADVPWQTRTERPARPPSRWQETHDVTPDRTAAAMADRGIDGLPERQPAAVRRPPRERGVTAGLDQDRPRVTRVSRGVDAGELGADAARELAPHERKQESPLARLERFPPLKRAVILAEILGRPAPR